MPPSKLLDYSQVTRANQITLKKDILKRLNVKEGDLIGFFDVDGQIILKKVKMIEDSR